MGRTTEFINYINEKYEPIPLDKKAVYPHISFVKLVQLARKEYRKRIRGK